MNKVLNEIFEVSGNLELTQELICVMINMVEDRDASTPDGALYFASQQDALAALLHIALDYVFSARMALDALQDRKECAA